MVHLSCRSPYLSLLGLMNWYPWSYHKRLCCRQNRDDRHCYDSSQPCQSFNILEVENYWLVDSAKVFLLRTDYSTLL